MEFLGQAIQAVQRNLGALGLYLLITGGSSAAGISLAEATGLAQGNPYEDSRLFLMQVGFSVAVVAVVAVAQAIVFARFGREMDRPLWKVRDDREALRRFFAVWFVLNLAVVALQEAMGLLHVLLNQPGLAAVAFLLWSFLMTVYVPVGACVMFTGRVTRESLRESLRPIGRQLGRIVPVLVLSAAVFFFLEILLERTQGQPWLRPAIVIISGYFDCVVFAATWLICIYDRQNPEEADLDF